ncbi:restriction endonuclease subunit S [Enterococcus faecium]|uniref:restriction endonuclease subunit S n=2 Tax=Enterococcus faecium TaxID=1352 RepID=UPI001DB18B34|nr:restriction endonuclease subunit S [Enterococcus faecium]
MSNDTQPEIRFPGFTDDWKQRKLGEVVQIVMGQSPNSENYTDNPNDYILVQGNADMKNNRVVPRVWTTQVTKQAEKGDLILSVRAPVGDIGKTDYDVVLGRGVAAIKGNDFIFQQLGKMKENGYWNRYSTGSTFESINSNDIREALITIPDVKEQQKIGAFFKQLDDTIALHQRKLDLLKETKKGFLQKMFPKNGAKVPEIRFPGFTEDWEQRKLGDVTAEVFQGINTAGDKVEYSDTGTPILQAKHITGGDVTFDEARFLDKERYSNYFPKYVPVENDILFANIGTIGPSTVVRDESEFLVAWNILKITLKKPEIAEFIQLQLDQLNQKHYFDSVLTGNATKFVNKDEMLRTPISVPTIEEQKKVGVFFSNIQRAITLHQRKLDLLKETKKGFLQKMFV